MTPADKKPETVTLDEKGLKLTRQLQAFMHDPKNSIQGDCYRTAVACVLGVDRDSVPHSHDDLTGPEAETFIDAWLRPQGLRRIFIPVLGDDFKEVANAMYPRGGGLPLMVTGRGPRDVNHVVVVHGIDDFWCPTLGSVSAEVALIGPALPDGYFWAEWIVRDPTTPANPAQVTDALTAAVVALARHGIEPDVQSLLIDGNPSRGIRPGAINAALTAAIGAGGQAVALPPMTERGLQGQIMDAAWPEFGGDMQTAEFWNDFGAGVEFTLKAFSHPVQPAPSTPKGWRPDCATEGCGKPASVHFIRGDIGSHYCHACYRKVQALPAAPKQETNAPKGGLS